MQFGHTLGLFVQQARVQYVGKELVIAVPLATVVERGQEQVSTIQGIEHGFATVLARDVVAEWSGQPAQDGGLQQEGLDLVGLALHHLLHQVVDDVAVIAGEARDEAGEVVPSLHRERRELESGDPPLGATRQRGHIGRRQLQAHPIVEVCRRFVRREAQLGRANLDQLAAGA